MKKKNKTIVMLSAKRCGSTAIFKLFQKHPNVKTIHLNQKLDNWEPQFWSYASNALKGKKNLFFKRLNDTLGVDYSVKKLNQKKIYEIYDKIVNDLGGIVFDKSPQYLGDYDAVNLMLNYKKFTTNQLIIFAMIRNPLDAISSQHELWNSYIPNENLKIREQNWLLKYKHLEKIKKNNNIKLFYYEKFFNNPKENVKKLMQYCDINCYDNLHNHLRLTSVGRYNVSLFNTIRNWKWGKSFEKHLKKYGYHKYYDNISFSKKIAIFSSSLKRYVVPAIKKLYKKINDLR